MSDDIVRCMNCDLAAIKSNFSKSKGLCPKCGSPVVQEYIDFYSEHSKEMKNAK